MLAGGGGVLMVSTGPVSKIDAVKYRYCGQTCRTSERDPKVLSEGKC